MFIIFLYTVNHTFPQSLPPVPVSRPNNYVPLPKLPSKSPCLSFIRFTHTHVCGAATVIVSSVCPLPHFLEDQNIEII